MISIYNIALLPANQSKQIVQYSQIFSKIAYKYLLGERALPHVTLCQFLARRKKAIDLWERTIQLLETKSIQLTFKKFESITFDNKIFWISLNPEPNDVLFKMHCQVANHVKWPLNKSYEKYSPHITLANTRIKEHHSFMDQLSNIYTPFTDSFSIALGKSDIAGQFLESVGSSLKS